VPRTFKEVAYVKLEVTRRAWSEFLLSEFRRGHVRGPISSSLATRIPHSVA
jgi:hypothetical protein